MLPDAIRDALARKVEGFFCDGDSRLRDAALRLQDDGYGDTDILNIMKGVYDAGRSCGQEEGYQQGHEDGWDEATYG
jgi:hypothetical protein